MLAQWVTCTKARENIYVKDEWNDVLNTFDVTLVKDDDKQNYFELATSNQA